MERDPAAVSNQFSFLMAARTSELCVRDFFLYFTEPSVYHVCGQRYALGRNHKHIPFLGALTLSIFSNHPMKTTQLYSSMIYNSMIFWGERDFLSLYTWPNLIQAKPSKL